MLFGKVLQVMYLHKNCSTKEILDKLFEKRSHFLKKKNTPVRYPTQLLSFTVHSCLLLLKVKCMVLELNTGRCTSM